MNKRILMSIAAAATIAATFTGCGSNNSESTSSVSGSAVKAELKGATVTAGTATATTDSTTGAFTIAAPTSATDIEITGGTYTLNGVDKTNSVTLKATKAQVNNGIGVSMLTTLIKEFDGNVSAACNALGVDYTDGVTDIANVDAGDFESAAVAVALSMEKVTILGTFISTLKSASTAKLNVSQLVTQLKTAAAAGGATDINDTLTSIGNGYALGHALAMANGDANLSSYSASTYAMSNVINLEGNSSADSAMYTVNGSAPYTSIARSGAAIASSSTNMDNNATAIMFNLKDYNTTLTNANGNTSLFVKLIGLDAANANNSYIMGLTGLDIATDSDDNVTLGSNANMSLSTIANSNVSYAVAANSNATVLFGSGTGADIFLSSTSGYNTVNVARFKNYMDSIYTGENSNTSTIGNFTSGMNSGNYSLKVYVNIDDRNMTMDSRLSNIISSDMTQTTNNGAKVFDGLRGYKVLDTNLSY